MKISFDEFGWDSDLIEYSDGFFQVGDSAAISVGESRFNMIQYFFGDAWTLRGLGGAK